MIPISLDPTEELLKSSFRYKDLPRRLLLSYTLPHYSILPSSFNCFSNSWIKKRNMVHYSLRLRSCIFFLLEFVFLLCVRGMPATKWEGKVINLEQQYPSGFSFSLLPASLYPLCLPPICSGLFHFCSKRFPEAQLPFGLQNPTTIPHRENKVLSHICSSSGFMHLLPYNNIWVYLGGCCNNS